jgi:hypothetical protein
MMVFSVFTLVGVGRTDEHGMTLAPSTLPAPASIEHLVMVCVHSGAMEDTPKTLTYKPYWRKAGGTCTASRSLLRYVDMPRSANAGNRLVLARQIANPMPPCGAACAM